MGEPDAPGPGVEGAEPSRPLGPLSIPAHHASDNEQWLFSPIDDAVDSDDLVEGEAPPSTTHGDSGDVSLVIEIPVPDGLRPEAGADECDLLPTVDAGPPVRGGEASIAPGGEDGGRPSEVWETIGFQIRVDAPEALRAPLDVMQRIRVPARRQPGPSDGPARGASPPAGLGGVWWGAFQAPGVGGRAMLVVVTFLLALALATVYGGTSGSEAYYVQMRTHAADAERVVVVGDFNDWDAQVDRLQATAGGYWEGWVRVPTGRHRYVFLVDGGVAVADEERRVEVDPEQGRRVSILVVPDIRASPANIEPDR